MPVLDLPRPFGRPSRGLFLLLLAVLGVSPGQAGQTRTWTQSEFADFEKGIIKNLSLRSDGLLTLAPRFHEVFDSGASYLWAVAQDSKGDLYTGGGPGAKLFRVSPKGEKKTVAEFDGLEVQAIAIDAHDRVYVGTSPDGKVYRIAPGGGKSEVFYSPKAKYVWALGFESRGDLLVATGDPGQVHRVSPDGKGSVFFQTDETHVRSMTVDPHDNLILGTDPGGLILRVSPDGKGFVLYQMGKKEITSVAVARDGSIYAAGVGNKGSSGFSVGPSLSPPPAPVQTGVGGAQAAMHTAPAPAPAGGSAPAAVPGGSELYRIDLNGNPRRVWGHPRDIVYAIGFDSSGKVLIGTGNKGYIYRIESDTLHTALLNAAPTQITGFFQARDGRLFAATGNVGKLYEIGPGIESEGSFESEVFDSGMYTVWGRLSFEAALDGGTVTLAARTGNLDQPQKNWSPWSVPPITSTKGARLTVPPARFVQWKAALTAGEGGRSPQLESVDVAYLPKNVPPRVEEVEVTPVNYKFPPPPILPLQPSQTLSLPAMGKRSQGGPGVSLDTTVTPTMQYGKGFIGARWTASDDNADQLIYSVLIRGVQETTWKPLKDKVREKYLSWDSTGFPDGEYRLRVIASDLPGNPPSEALVSSAESGLFLIDNTPPRISGLTATAAGGKLTARWKAVDALNNIKRAEYSLDGGEWTLAAPTNLLSDSPEESYELTVDNLATGEHTIAVRVQDDYDNESTDKAVVK